MPGLLTPDETLFVYTKRVSVMGRNSQLVAAALVEQHVPALNANWHKRGLREAWYLQLTAIGDVGLALLRLEASLPSQETLHALNGRSRHFDLREELYEVGLPTIYLRLEFALDIRTPSTAYDPLQRDLVERVHRSLRSLSFYQTPPGHPTWYQGSIMQVPRTVPAPRDERVVPLTREVPSVAWSAPLVSHVLNVEQRPPADAGPLVGYDIEVPSVGSHHQQPIFVRGFSASALLVTSLRKIHGIFVGLRTLDREREADIYEHQKNYIAVQAFLVLLLVETEAQASLHLDHLVSSTHSLHRLFEEQQRLLQVWEEKCTLTHAPRFAFDILVHGSPDEEDHDLPLYDSLRGWIMAVLNPTLDQPDAREDWARCSAGRFAVDCVDRLSRWWPSLQTVGEIREDGGIGPRKAVVVKRMEVAFGRVWHLFREATAERMLRRRRRAAEGRPSSGSESE
ncbi:hypothetical protein JCM11251_003410 [Rhodosporidiobolus azoricus]